MKHRNSYYVKKNRPHIKLRISFIILFIAASFALCFVFFMQGRGALLQENLVEQIFPADDSGFIRQDTSGLNPLKISTTQPENYLDKCLFVCSSNIADAVPDGADKLVIELHQGTMFRTRAANTNSKETVAKLVKSSDARNIYIFFDTRSTGISADEAAQGVGRFVDDIYTGKKKIYIMSVLPPSSEDITAAYCDKLNSLLLETANEKGVYYIDCSTPFRKSDGRMSGAYISGDSLNGDGRKLFERIILTRYA